MDNRGLFLWMPLPLGLLLLCRLSQSAPSSSTTEFVPIPSCNSPLLRVEGPSASIKTKDYTNGIYGLAFNSLDETFFAVKKKKSLVEFGLDGGLRSTIHFPKDLDHIEAVAVDKRYSRLLIGNKGTIYFLNFSRIASRFQQEDSTITVESDDFAIVLSLPSVASLADENSRITGLSVDGDSGIIYTVTEKKPPLLIVLQPPVVGSKINDTATAGSNETDEDGDSESQTRKVDKKEGEGVAVFQTTIEFARDLSAIAFDPSNETLWLLSPGSRQLYHISSGGEFMGAYPSPAEGHARAIEMMSEGDDKGKAVWIGVHGGSSGDRIRAYEVPGPCNTCTVAPYDGLIGSKKNHTNFYIELEDTRCNYDLVKLEEHRRNIDPYDESMELMILTMMICMAFGLVMGSIAYTIMALWHRFHGFDRF